jgi:protein-tyrosine phosphatase
MTNRAAQPKPARFIRTSHSHPLQINALRPHSGWGQLGLTFCPGKRGPSLSGHRWDRDLQVDIQALQDWGASAVLTLIEDSEFKLLKVPSLGEAIESAGLAWFHVPIKDVRPPDSRFEAAWPALSVDLLDRLRAGQSVVIHCRGGLGRAGTVAALLMRASGVSAHDAVTRVRAARPGAIETAEQLRYVMAEGSATRVGIQASREGDHGLV